MRSVFRLAARQPELLGLLREVGRLGPPAATQMTLALEPLVQRASSFLEAEMDAGTMRRHDPRPVAAGDLLHGDRHGDRGRGAAGARRGADRPLAGPPPGGRAAAAAFGAAGRGDRPTTSDRRLTAPHPSAARRRPLLGRLRDLLPGRRLRGVALVRGRRLAFARLWRAFSAVVGVRLAVLVPVAAPRPPGRSPWSSWSRSC